MMELSETVEISRRSVAEENSRNWSYGRRMLDRRPYDLSEDDLPSAIQVHWKLSHTSAQISAMSMLNIDSTSSPCMHTVGLVLWIFLVCLEFQNF